MKVTKLVLISMFVVIFLSAGSNLIETFKQLPGLVVGFSMLLVILFVVSSTYLITTKIWK